MRFAIDSKRLYLLNATVLITHEIDSAFWHEWELFGMPCSIQGFLVLNLLLVAAVIYGYEAPILRHPSGSYFYYGLAMGGLLAVVVHSVLLSQGSTAFINPASIGLLTATLLLSVLQVVFLCREIPVTHTS